MADLKQFAQNIKRTADGIRKNATALQRKTAGAILSALVPGTPVGNPLLWASNPRAGYVGGRARGNWQVSIGRAAPGIVEVADKDGATTIERGRTEIAMSMPGVSIHITNNVPYIIPLNEGHSRQAPAGFIETAVLIGVQEAKAGRVVP